MKVQICDGLKIREYEVPDEEPQKVEEAPVKVAEDPEVSELKPKKKAKR